MDNTKDKIIVEWEIDKLKPHPKQASLFGEPQPHEIEALAALIKREGFSVPIEILPGGTIICGHRRAKAAKSLGLTHIPAWVREDLVEQGANAIERRLIEDNLTRQTLNPLDVARCALGLKRLSQRQPGTKMSDREVGELRDKIGRELNLCGRHVSRLLRVAEKTPIEIQKAVSANLLSMDQALAVASLDTAKKEQIVEEINGGNDPKTVVGQFLPPKRKRHYPAFDDYPTFEDYPEFMTPFTQGLLALRNRVPGVPWTIERELEMLTVVEILVKDFVKIGKNLLRESPDVV